MKSRNLLTILVVGLFATPAAVARPFFARNCSMCHAASPPVDAVPEVINFDGFADPDESGTGATDRGLLKLFTVEPGESVDLSLLVDLQDVQDTHFAVELKGMELPGVEKEGQLIFTADPDWFMQIGTVEIDPLAPYYTIPQDMGMHYLEPTIFTFSMLVDASTTPDFYDLEFAMAGQPGYFYGDEHFYLQVLPEPASLMLVTLALGVWSGRRRFRSR